VAASNKTKESRSRGFSMCAKGKGSSVASLCDVR
jgi:hypothetical protein